MVLVLLTIMLKSGSSLAQARSRGLLPPADKCSAADIAALIGRGEKLLAIRLYRELNGGGLKDARLAVEELARNNQSR
jgi:ribosomal protein L7/L12